MKSYSSDLKIRAIQYYHECIQSLRKVSKLFRIGKSTLSRWIRFQEPKEFKSREKKLKNISKWISETLENKPWINLNRLIFKIREKWSINVSKSTLSRFLKSLGMTCKQLRKKTKVPQNDPIKIEKFKEEMREIGYDNILSFDEVGFIIDMIPKRGWSKKGERCIYSGKRRGHEHITGTFLISSKGVEKWWLSKEGMNVKMMLKYIDEFPIFCNKTIVLDNLRTHHNSDVIEKMKKKDLSPKFTLPYSPELNPIEEAFSWLKRELRKEVIQNKKELESSLEKLIPKLNTKDLINYYKHSYDSQK